VFKTGLTEQSETALKNRMNAFAFYGYPLVFNVEPNSGGKIKPNEFKIYVATDADNQKAPIDGLAVTNQAGIKFTPDAKKVDIRIAWVQPYTNNEVDLMAKTSFSIKQEEPSINTGRINVDYSGTAQKFKVRISGITVSAPGTGDDTKKAKVDVKIQGEPRKVDGLGSYGFSTEPIIDGDETGYNVELELTGKLDPGETRIKGTIEINLIGVATNTVNGVRSEPQPAILRIPVNYEPERGGGQRRR
jgi:hypothetical protein